MSNVDGYIMALITHGTGSLGGTIVTDVFVVFWFYDPFTMSPFKVLTRVWTTNDFRGWYGYNDDHLEESYKLWIYYDVRIRSLHNST